jgi:hypothetical protein
MPELWRPERRRTERHAVTFPLHVRLDGGDGVRLPVRGLSITGMVFESAEPLPTGSALVFTLDPPEQHGAGIGPIRGQVVHSRLVLPASASGAQVYVAGVAFAPVPADTRDRIARLLASVDDPAGGSHT